jgi:hypothetical protein
VEHLTEVFIYKLLSIPEKSKPDAVYLAFTAVFEINYLLTRIRTDDCYLI